MPVYEYRCRSCGSTFEARRSMADSDAPISCPEGHQDARRLLSVFASVGAAGEASGPGSGGGCGAACACAHR
ncbi:MAG TPA: zinc ribbon domain-containing protein [Acidimicrobiales bacterium]|nr:zinc ribbon domain-containing protein [Acidimicrobiales bacterium]